MATRHHTGQGRRRFGAGKRLKIHPLMLAAAMGTSISVEASGPEADAAIAALAALVESRFDED